MGELRLLSVSQRQNGKRSRLWPRCTTAVQPTDGPPKLLPPIKCTQYLVAQYCRSTPGLRWRNDLNTSYMPKEAQTQYNYQSITATQQGTQYTKYN